MSAYIALIPPTTRESIDRYVETGRRGGDFLDALLSNDLMGVFRHADTANMDAIVHIARYLYNEVPATAIGSKERVLMWSGGGGLVGMGLVR